MRYIAPIIVSALNVIVIVFIANCCFLSKCFLLKNRIGRASASVRSRVNPVYGWVRTVSPSRINVLNIAPDEKRSRNRRRKK